MGKPAARLGDMCAHGGSIVVGCPTVLIGGMPAARLGDMHVCPMMTPAGPAPIPHVGGPITLGSPMVLIGGMPAARLGDMATCVGPPDTIALGCMTVLIGEGGAGAASGGGAAGAGAPASAAATASAATALFDNNEVTSQQEHWVEIQFVDKAGNPVSGVSYKFTDPDNNESEGTLRLDGTIRRDGISDGQCKVILRSVFNAQWDKEAAEVGEKVKLSAETEGFEDGTLATIQIFKRDIKGPDVVFDTMQIEVKGDKVEAEWEYVYPEDTDDKLAEDDIPESYSNPEYYFNVIVESCKARSELLSYKDYVEIELKDEDGNTIGEEEYNLYLSNGEVRSGKLDPNGYKKEENVPVSYFAVKFPNLPDM